MRACREGGDAIEAALRSLDRAYFATLHRESTRVLRDPEAANDLVQDTFIRVWQRCATFHGDSELLAWVRSILRHAMLDRLRRPQREVPMEKDGQVTGEATRSMAVLSSQREGGPHEEAHRRQLAESFQRGWDAFQEAAPRHAAVMAWIVEDGLSNDEISELLGRTPGATREFVSQCRKRARVHLAEWYQLALGAGEVR